MDAFKKTALELRDKNVLSIDPASVMKVTIATSLPATTRPTTRAASESVVTLDRRPLATTAPASTSPTTTASTRPAVKHSVWEVASVNPPIDAADSKVNSLLSVLHPLVVQQYDATPTTAPATADRYSITIECPPPLISNYKIELTDPGDSRPLIGRYNDLSFEVDRALLDKIKADFSKPDEATPAPTASPSFPPAGSTPGPSGP
jgi:hypothetical protein